MFTFCTGVDVPGFAALSLAMKLNGTGPCSPSACKAAAESANWKVLVLLWLGTVESGPGAPTSCTLTELSSRPDPPAGSSTSTCTLTVALPANCVDGTPKLPNVGGSLSMRMLPPSADPALCTLSCALASSGTLACVPLATPRSPSGTAHE